MSEQRNNNRRKRIRVSLARIKGRNRKLRQRLGEYRKLLFVTGAALVVMLFLVGFAALKEARPEPVLLGEGRAGLKTSAELAADSLRLTEQQAGEVAETTASRDPEDPPGTPFGSGSASYYSEELAGQPTASGEAFDPGALTAAHPTLPFGSRVRVTNVRNGKSVVVRINDRGPYTGNRVIDLSHAAAGQLGFLKSGTADVRLELIRGG